MVAGFIGGEAGNDGDGGDDDVDEDEERSGSDPCDDGSPHEDIVAVVVAAPAAELESLWWRGSIYKMLTQETRKTKMLDA